MDMKRPPAVDSISMMSIDSTTSNDSKEPGVTIGAGDIRRRLSEWVTAPKKQFKVLNPT